MRTSNSNSNTSKSFINHCFLSEKISSPVLEIGSGKDEFSRVLFSRKYKVITTNIYPHNLVDYICSVACLPFEDNSFGCVICEHVLEHVEDPKKAIAEIFRVLKPGGLLILVTPFNWPLHNKPYDLWRFSEEGLRVILTKHFEKIEFNTTGNPSNPKLYCVSARKAAPKEQKPHPKVSVIMPTYNRADMLPKAIGSALKQTLKDWELIVVNDGGTDNTAEVMEHYKDPRIRYYEKANGGPASARNFGLRRAQGEYVAYCDDDDFIAPYHLETLSSYLDRHPEVGMVRGHVVYDFTTASSVSTIRLGFLWATMHHFRYLKKKIYFDNNQLIDEDIDFILRFSDRYIVRTIPTVVSTCVRHDKNLTSTKSVQVLHYNDRLYTKRITIVCKTEELKKEYFMMLAYLLGETNSTNALSVLAHYFQDTFPNSIEAAYINALCNYRQGKIKQAIGYLRWIIVQKANRRILAAKNDGLIKEYTYTFLSWIYSTKIKKRELALRYALEGSRRFPKSLLLKLELFHAYIYSNRLSNAFSLSAKFTDINLANYCAGVTALANGDSSRAEKYFKKSSKMPTLLLYRLQQSLSTLYRKMADTDTADSFRKQAYMSTQLTLMKPLKNIVKAKTVRDTKFKHILERVFLPDWSHNKAVLKKEQP